MSRLVLKYPEPVVTEESGHGALFDITPQSAPVIFTPVCFAVNVHYKNGILLECFTWDSEVDNINRLTSSDYGEAMSQAISWVREQFEQPVIDQPVPQQPRLAA